jgi:hypothetical protein
LSTRGLKILYPKITTTRHLLNLAKVWIFMLNTIEVHKNYWFKKGLPDSELVPIFTR